MIEVFFSFCNLLLTSFTGEDLAAGGMDSHVSGHHAGGGHDATDSMFGAAGEAADDDAHGGHGSGGITI